MNIVFMGTPDFSVPSLEELHKKGHNISLVITQEDKRRGRGKKVHFTPVKQKAVDLGLEVYQPADVNSEESISKIKEANPDVIIVIAYGQILSEDILNYPKYGCLNLHASLLPKYRGAAPINRVVIDGDTVSGNTIMKMDKGLDTGDMVSKDEVEITEDMTAGELHDILMIRGSKQLIDTLEEIEKAGKTEGEPQDDSKSSYAHMMDKSLGKIDWSKSAVEINNLIRGTQPWPGSFFDYDGKTVKVRKARVEEKNVKDELGTIIGVSDKGIEVATGDGIIILEEIQFEGKRWMTVEEYLRGNTIDKIKLN